MLVRNLLKKFPQKAATLQALVAKNFARGGPYNPNRYKDYMVPRTLPKHEEIYEFINSVHSVPGSPIRNIRHINPVRESGPLPTYSGTYTMEDLRDIWYNCSVGRDFCYC
jgi:hypothetical protein